MDKDYIDIYSKLLLNRIKGIVKSRLVEKDESREKATDEKMLKVIESLIVEINGKRKDDLNISFFVNEMNDGRFLEALCMQYVAIYNDNLELLNEILDNNIHLDLSDLVVLYKRLTDKVDRKTYLYLLKKEKKAVINFLYSIILSDDDSIINENATSRFANIVNKNPDVFYVDDKSGYYSFITKESLKWFNDETLSNTTDEQKTMIKRLYDSYSSKDEVKATYASLVINNNFSKEVYYFEDLLDTFTIEEILRMSDEQIKSINNYHLWRNPREKKEKNKFIKKIKKKLNK